jgi:hypothetical protein
MSIDIKGMRHWVDSVRETHLPREDIPRGETPKYINEAFLACSLRYLEATLKELEEERAKPKVVVADTITGDIHM